MTLRLGAAPGRCPACWTIPETTSPSRPDHSLWLSSLSASRSRCRMTWRAVLVATRPKPAGVSSHSRTTEPSSAELLGEHADLAGLAVELDPGGVLRALGVPVRGQQGRLDGLAHQLEGDVLLALEAAQRGHVDLHASSSRSSRRRRTRRRPGRRRPRRPRPASSSGVVVRAGRRRCPAGRRTRPAPARGRPPPAAAGARRAAPRVVGRVRRPVTGSRRRGARSPGGRRCAASAGAR